MVEAMIEKLKTHEFGRGDVIVSEKERSRNLFLIAKGKVEFSIPGEYGERLSLAIMASGDYFGDASMVYEEARAAKVVALTDCVLFGLSKKDFIPIRLTSLYTRWDDPGKGHSKKQKNSRVKKYLF